jgi:hypothetical protein
VLGILIAGVSNTLFQLIAAAAGLAFAWNGKML